MDLSKSHDFIENPALKLRKTIGGVYSKKENLQENLILDTSTNMDSGYRKINEADSFYRLTIAGPVKGRVNIGLAAMISKVLEVA